MSMNNSSNRRRNIEGAKDHRFIFYRKGYVDAMNDIPFDHNFVDRISMAEGAAYQRGRLMVIAMKQMGINPPMWNTDKMIPPKVKSAIDNVMLIGRKDHNKGIGHFVALNSNFHGFSRNIQE